MKPCKLRDTYLDAGLPPEESAAFESHLPRCRECADWVNEWRMFERGVNRWAEARNVPPVNAEEAAALVRRAEAAKERQHRAGYRLGRPIVALGATAAAAMAVAMVFVLKEPEAPRDENVPVSRGPAVAEAIVKGMGDADISKKAGEQLVAPTDHPITAVIEKDTVALSSKGRMKLIRLERGKVRLGLEAGTVACRVDKRAKNEDFVVVAGGYSVRVVGTRFSVTRKGDGIDVVVQEGAVQVDREDGGHWMLKAGDVLTGSDGEPEVKRADERALSRIDTLFAPPVVEQDKAAAALPSVDQELQEPAVSDAPPMEEDILPDDGMDITPAVPASARLRREHPVADLAGWRRAIIEGDPDAARREMRTYLKSSPKDPRAWTLYADASRKSRDFDEAVKAYKKVIAVGGDADASRAMYMLGTIYQAPLNKHRKAVKMLRAYKRSGHVSSELGELTDVKIAKSLVALDECDAAQEAVAHLLERSGSFVAENARKMIESCGNASAPSSAE